MKSFSTIENQHPKQYTRIKLGDMRRKKTARIACADVHFWNFNHVTANTFWILLVNFSIYLKHILKPKLGETPVVAWSPFWPSSASNYGPHILPLHTPPKPGCHIDVSKDFFRIRLDVQLTCTFLQPHYTNCLGTLARPHSMNSTNGWSRMSHKAISPLHTMMKASWKEARNASCLNATFWKNISLFQCRNY